MRKMSIGIDFGTTNTIISQIYADGQSPKLLKFGQKEDAFIPSVLAIKNNSNSIVRIGKTAKSIIGHTDDNYKVFSNIKMLLGESVGHQYWNHAVDPNTIVQLFLKNIFELVKNEHKIEIDKVVVTAPEIWHEPRNQKKREALIQCIRQCGIKNVKIENEPIAAATYYLQKLNEHENKLFTGYLLVCDCGGGTLDFCLLKIDYCPDSKMPLLKILKRVGAGRVDKNNIGCAGVAYDHAIIRKLFPDLELEKPADISLFFKRANEFETLKIDNTDLIEELIKNAQLSNLKEDWDETIFKIEDQRITAKLLVDTFNEYIAGEIKQIINGLKKDDMFKSCSNDVDKFRVLNVGGFSNFFPLRKLIQQSFATLGTINFTTDPRFRDILTYENKLSAISKGAALIANDMATIIHTCPIEFGIRIHDPVTHNFNYQPLITQGELLSKYKEPQWYLPFNDQDHYINLRRSDNIVPVYFKETSNSALTSIELNVTMNDIVEADPDDEHLAVDIGLSADEDQVFYLHVRNRRSNQIKKTSLGVFSTFINQQE